MKISKMFGLAFLSPLLLSGLALAQSSQPGAPVPAAPAASSKPALPPAPLKLTDIKPPKEITFPAPNPKNFTAATPTTQEVNAFLKALWGYDAKRAWSVAGIETTKAPSVSRVTVLVAEQGVSHEPAATVFFVTPDGQHAIAGNDVIVFGPHPFLQVGEKLQQQADGPYRGSNSKSLMLVEFADLQCPHCKEAAPTMDKLATDFPNARIVFENFPLTNVHPAAAKAAEYGVCVAQEKGNAAFFQYAQAVYDTQSDLEKNADQTLNNAATKAGANAAQVSTCAAGAEAKAKVAASIKLGQEIGVSETPLLFVNGRMVPIGGLPYDMVKQIVAYTAEQSPLAHSTTASK